MDIGLAHRLDGMSMGYTQESIITWRLGQESGKQGAERGVAVGEAYKLTIWDDRIACLQWIKWTLGMIFKSETLSPTILPAPQILLLLKLPYSVGSLSGGVLEGWLKYRYLLDFRLTHRKYAIWLS